MFAPGTNQAVLRWAQLESLAIWTSNKRIEQQTVTRAGEPRNNVIVAPFETAPSIW